MGVVEHPAFVFGEIALHGFGIEEDAVAGSAGLKIGGLEHALVDKSEDQAIGDGMAERFEEVESKRGAAVIDLVEEAEIGVEAGAFEEGAEFVHDEGIGEREEGVEGIGGGMFDTAGPGEFGLIEEHEELKVLAGGGTFDAIEGGDVGSGFEGGEGGGEGGAAGVEIVAGAGVTAVEVESGEAVGDFGGDDGFGDGEGGGGFAEGGELGDAEVDVFAARGFEGAAVLALAREETEGDAFFEKLGHGLGGDLDVTEEEDGFEFVIGNIEEEFVLLFDQEAVAGFAENGTLLGEVEVSHGFVPSCVLGWGLNELDAGEGDFEGGFGRGHFETGAHGGGERAGHEDDAAGFAFAAPGNPDAFAEEESTEEAEAVIEIRDAGFAVVEFEVALREEGFGLQERLPGFFGGLGENDEIIGVADKFAAGFFEFAVKIFEEEIGEEGRDGRALGNAGAEWEDFGAIPNGGFDPEF